MFAVAKAPVRSKTSPRRAGGAERRARDDGGHDIAARFDGPTEAFSHVAQDASFDRGSYRLIEDEWARAKRAGRVVTEKIDPDEDVIECRDQASRRRFDEKPIVYPPWPPEDDLMD